MPLELATIGLVRELASGDSIVTLAADPTLASFGDEEDAVLEAQMYLAEHLSKAEPEVVARFALPDGTRLHATDVLVPREDLGRRWNVTTPIRVTSLVIPTLPNTKGLRDAWVMVVPLLHTFFVTAGEDLDEAIVSEVKRIVAARELSPLEYLDLLPPRAEEIVRLEVELRRAGATEIARGANRERRLAEHEAKQHAIAILDSIAEPIHAGLGGAGRREPGVFPLRDAELALLRSMLGATTRASVLLLGKERVGKTGLFRAWLEQEHEVNRPRFVYATSGARLIAGMSGFGQWQERVRRVMEAAALLDAIIYFDDLGDLFADRPGGHVDLPSAIRPFLEDGRVRVVGELREELLDRVEVQNGGFFACFGRVRLDPFDAKRALVVLAELGREQASREPERPRLGADANAALVELADRYLPYESFPGKAVRLASEIRAAAEIALGSAAAGATIGADTVHEAFSLRTGVPLFLLRDDRALRQEDVVLELRRRLVGQDEAVKRVAELVCVVKAGLQPAGKPLATLLFVGPTGVGKTELARALSTLLFGSEERLVRFDMSEYASAYATERLFRGNDGGEGLLTRRVREQPFSVILLDEIEKAHPAAFDLLLQVCGEGRLTDGRGKTAWFHNTILILTSNLGAMHRRAGAGFGGGAGIAGDAAHYEKVVRETFRPELVNRIDRIVTFRSLEQADIDEVARIATGRAARRRGLVERGIELSVSVRAVARLAETGMSEAYGARALRRHVERELVTPVGRLVSARGAIDGARVVVAMKDEPLAAGEEPAGGDDRGEAHLRFGIVRTAARRGGNGAHALERITELRRTMHRHMRLERILQLEDHVAYLVAQLGHGGGKKKRRDAEAPDGQELAQMTGEHTRLEALCDGLRSALADVFIAEELALVGFVAGERIADLEVEATEAGRRFRRVLVHALVAQERRRNAITLMVKELDARRGFDLWLLPLLRDCERRKWQVSVHLDADRDREGTDWPDDRRWGPPLDVASALARLVDRERTFRNVILRVDGDHAALWLGLETGTHRFVGFAGHGSEPAHLHVEAALLRSNVLAHEWEPPSLEPPNTQAAEALAREPPVRIVDALREDVVIAQGAGAEVALPHHEYWSSHEDIALAHLLLFERDASLDRDDHLRPLHDDAFAEVRALARGNQKIQAIRRYRELTGGSLLEAKNAVEAMT